MCRLTPVKTNFGTEVDVADIKRAYVENIIRYASGCSKIDAIYLFGSSIEERCNEQSDIDIAIVSNVPRSRLFRTQSYSTFVHNIYKSDMEQSYDFLQFNSHEALKNSNAPICHEINNKGKMIYRRKQDV